METPQGKDSKKRGKGKKNNLVRAGKWYMTCITYKLIGEPKPLEVINGVVVKNKEEQGKVEKYLKELYEFESEKDYKDFVKNFIIQDK